MHGDYTEAERLIASKLARHHSTLRAGPRHYSSSPYWKEPKANAPCPFDVGQIARDQIVLASAAVRVIAGEVPTYPEFGGEG